MALLDTRKESDKLRRSGMTEAEASTGVEVVEDAGEKLVTTETLDSRWESLMAMLAAMDERTQAAIAALDQQTKAAIAAMEERNAAALARLEAEIHKVARTTMLQFAAIMGGYSAIITIIVVFAT